MFKMLFTFALGLLALQSPQVASAQNTPYEGTTPEEAAQATAGSDENTIYLYNVGHRKWLSRGGTWGTEAVLSDIPMEFTVSISNVTEVYNSNNGEYYENGNKEEYQLTDKQEVTDITYLFHSTTQMEGSNDANGYLTLMKFNSTGGDADYTMGNGSHDSLNFFTDQVRSAFKLTRVGDATQNIYQISVPYNYYYKNSSKVQSNMYWYNEEKVRGGVYYMVGMRNPNSTSTEDTPGAINGFIESEIPEGDLDKWILVSKKELKEFFEKVDASNTGLTPAHFLMYDGDFARKDNSVSNWKTADEKDLNYNNKIKVKPSEQKETYYVGNGNDEGNSIQQETGAYWTANIHGAQGEIYQTVTAPRQGYYEIRLQGFTSSDKAAKLYASANASTVDTKDVQTQYKENYLITYTPTDISYVEASQYVNPLSYTVVRVYVPEANSPISFGVKVEDGDENTWTCFDNVQIYYCGDAAINIILDEAQTSADYLNEQNTEDVRQSKVNVYLHRSLNAGKWNSLVLPISLSDSNIKEVFGSNTIYSVFEGATHPEYPNRIYFNQTTDGIEANKLYIIKPEKGEPTDQPEVASSVNEAYKLKGSYYTILAMSKQYGGTTEDGTPFFNAQVTGDAGNETYTGERQVRFVGTLVADEDGEKTIPANSYVLAGNNTANGAVQGLWYYRTVETKTKGFRGWLQTESAEQAKNMQFVINGVLDDESNKTVVTAITGTTATTQAHADGVYNLNGQLVRQGVSLEGLSQGIYIVDGRKVVVK